MYLQFLSDEIFLFLIFLHRRETAYSGHQRDAGCPSYPMFDWSGEGVEGELQEPGEQRVLLPPREV